jgi:hypothetical protein
MGMRPGAIVMALGLVLPAPASVPAERFREANDAARGGDYPRAISAYAELASSGAESASLYWNWSQAAAARGAMGEALWALLRARELEPGDKALGREIERVREGANLDAAEIAPEPLLALGRASRRFHLGDLALALGALSVLLHAAARRWPAQRPLRGGSVLALVLALLASVSPVGASFARPTGTVVRRGAPLLDAASGTAETVGALREGEAVPILQESGEFLRVEDSSGARGWARAEDVRRLDRAPTPPS